MNYDSLLQNKRKKMLFLVLLLVICPFINVAGINLTYIVKKDENVISPSCIAEELERYAAVGWVYPIPVSQENIPNITTKYIPTINNDYNCQFSSNNLCSSRWSLRNWKIDENSQKTRDVFTDRRWEDLPTILISNTSKEFSEKIEVELFSNKIFSSLPKDLKDDYKNGSLGNYKAYSDILSSKEWRNLILSSDANGLIKLIDVDLNRTLIEHNVQEALTPMYMLMRSANCSLWKIHQNHFLYTNVTNISRLGPQLTIPGRDLCVSLFVTTCSNCQMTFFYQDDTNRKILKQVGPTKNEEWMEIKLKEENIQLEKVNLLVEAKFMNNNLSVPGFWAIDDVRVCNENEVKMTFLKMVDTSGNFSEDEIFCQLIRKPSWRPKKLTYQGIKDFPKISSVITTNSIKLSWAQEEPDNQISYFVSYQANPLEYENCMETHDSNRMKSNGFVSTKLNEIVLENLIPYTEYNINISSVLHQNDQKVLLRTLQTVEPSLEELPFNIQIKALDTSINVSWEKIDCSKKVGPILYSIIVGGTNYSTVLARRIKNSYEIGGLQPNTPYTLEILTSRNERNMYNGQPNKFVFNFTTMAGVAPPVENLELYSIDPNSASLRYELPSEPHGIIREIQVSKCNSLSFSKCKSSITAIKPCNIWPGKYCAEANFLIPFQSYSFRVSLKNLHTPKFGQEVSVNGFTTDRVPGKPTNITYKIVDCHVSTDYCHLNVTWLHPYDQNGTITSFNIILNSTDKRKDSEDDKYIHEIYMVNNKRYYHDYTYQIKYLPYSSYYNLYLQSANTAFNSDFAQLNVETDNIGDHIDQSPKLIAKSDSTLLFKIPRLDSRLDFYSLTVVVQDFNKTEKIDSHLLKNRKIAENICHQFGESWISQVVKVTNSSKTEKLIIDSTGKNKLKPETKYCITFIITNKYKNSEHDVVYYEKLRMPGIQPPPTTPGSYNHLYMLLLLLLLIPVAFVIYRYLRKRKVIAKSLENNENVYETLPFDECEPNGSDVTDGRVSSFSNKTYNR
ncbi:hypothetical protein JTB14_020070 [Gonioctena quinquepunctata]|nr:hypothetical protein JTB14_020070 [Gonioctena quinquepunctata]